MAKRIALNRVEGESDIRHQRDDAGIAQIDAAVKDPRRIKSMTRLVLLLHNAAISYRFHVVTLEKSKPSVKERLAEQSENAASPQEFRHVRADRLLL
jgi:hypothetical protein